MPKLQRKEIQGHSMSQEAELSALRSASIVSVAGDAHAEVASPARDLMAHLNFELTADVSRSEVEIEKYPLKWTVIGLTLFCGLAWYGLLSLIL